ncbi:bifunctional phosphopantothenoylcysteine decarboxylase/phosphopantothenate--cysteine ligase CoaBC [Herpetosiphon llansteffanensis]|uniref:bifunctional phosphopantothenoylcysteine decarboxylase/phosphopantothenate--cysteine ligase CoaBC n=1 Tax=Herpetosiphon llansteffanensis TaxID=2094568 RepID=UPI000D7C88F1|nr:bifunctional phosphopantothenoylcysteine decarboxylase/phosphopantothenate--cysteine ligase CoaBC [Herpetosiphon llansteffanensis]
MSLVDRRIVLGVTGGIAAYKVVQLARNLSLAGALVDVVMTEEATKFVTPLTFGALTHRPVYTDMWQLSEGTDIGHVTIGDRADLIIIAPATANTIARLAMGMSDDMLTTTVLASRAPILLAPAMNVNMWANPATQANVATLQSRGFQIIPPTAGRMAEPMVGVGRLAEIDQIEAEIRLALGKKFGALAGKRLVISAGGTHEAIDPVRFIGNRSSGAMGFALAAAARDAGADVRLIIGAASATPPLGTQQIYAESAAAMQAAIEHEIDQGCDMLIMAAAVADYRPVSVADNKIKKTEQGDQSLNLQLTHTTDILASLKARTGFVKIGFAAETHDLEHYAQAKLTRKGLDAIVANDARTALGASDNAVTVFSSDGQRWDFARQAKTELAQQLIALFSGFLKM